MMSGFPNFLNFREPSNNFGTFPKVYFNKKTPIGSGLKRVAAGSVSERYQTILCAHLSKILFENVKFFSTFFCELFNIQKAPSTINRYGVNLQWENVFAIAQVGKNLGMTQKQK